MSVQTEVSPNDVVPSVQQLTDSSQELRDQALGHLVKIRDLFPDLAPLLWYSYGTISVLINEVTSVYPYLPLQRLPGPVMTRASNALSLLQCVASSAETCAAFIEAKVPIFFYPILKTTNANFEYLRTTCLGVIGALVKADNDNVINFMLTTDIFPICLNIMTFGNELNKTVSTFIVQRIITNEKGLNYICEVKRLELVAKSLYNMLSDPNSNMTPRLFKHIVKCYYRLSDNSDTLQTLKDNTPPILFEDRSIQLCANDEAVLKWLETYRNRLSMADNNN